MYSDLLLLKGNGTPYDQLQSVDPKNIITAPGDYLAFLSQIGFGELGNGQFMLYSGPISIDEIYGHVDGYLEHILLLGDDFQGFNVGYDSKTWKVVEVDSTDMSIIEIAPTFKDFIRQKIRDLIS